MICLFFIFSLANNQLVALPPELFSGPSSRLEELYLQNNSLSVLAPGLFAPLEHLLVLNLSRNELTNDWVTSASLSPLVRLVALDLSYNKVWRNLILPIRYSLKDWKLHIETFYKYDLSKIQSF